MLTTLSDSTRKYAMKSRVCFVLVTLAVQVVLSRQWSALEEKKSTKIRKSAPEISKQHQSGNHETKRWVARESGYRELRKKPSGHLTPLRPDDMDNDGVVSIAVGPPPIRPKFDKSKVVRNKNNKDNNTLNSRTTNNNAVSFVKDVLTQIGREFLSHQVNEDFVFGQYVGNAMKNLTGAIKLKMQHEILDLIVKYQRNNNGESITKEQNITREEIKPREEDKYVGPKYAKTDKNNTNINETEEPWPDFSNLAKIVG